MCRAVGCTGAAALCEAAESQEPERFLKYYRALRREGMEQISSHASRQTAPAGHTLLTARCRLPRRWRLA
jgi:hypothetical protein